MGVAGNKCKKRDIYENEVIPTGECGDDKMWTRVPPSEANSRMGAERDGRPEVHPFPVGDYPARIELSAGSAYFPAPG